MNEASQAENPTFLSCVVICVIRSERFGHATSRGTNGSRRFAWEYVVSPEPEMAAATNKIVSIGHLHGSVYRFQDTVPGDCIQRGIIPLTCYLRCSDSEPLLRRSSLPRRAPRMSGTFPRTRKLQRGQGAGGI